MATLFDLYVYREVVALFNNDLVTDSGARELLASAGPLATFNLILFVVFYIHLTS